MAERRLHCEPKSAQLNELIVSVESQLELIVWGELLGKAYKRSPTTLDGKLWYSEAGGLVKCYDDYTRSHNEKYRQLLIDLLPEGDDVESLPGNELCWEGMKNANAQLLREIWGKFVQDERFCLHGKNVQPAKRQQALEQTMQMAHRRKRYDTYCLCQLAGDLLELDAKVELMSELSERMIGIRASVVDSASHVHGKVIPEAGRRQSERSAKPSYVPSTEELLRAPLRKMAV